ncbi:MAG: hypothetical protein BGP12_15305 [Rhodospirillales bacterium 70-18]|nr:MAG: hypothetical protein BGP12_15305 [Rhodospirillales bacterium 70-18]
MEQSVQPTLFEALIVPHRSLSARALRLLLVAICGLSGGTGALFVWLGAWPVGGFTGVELLLAAWLFRLNARAARATELLLLSPTGLRVVRTAPDGRRHEVVLKPGWLNVALQERPGRVPALLLVSHGVREEVGATLGEAEKRDLAEALRQALDRWRNPVFDNPQLREPQPSG